MYRDMLHQYLQNALNHNCLNLDIEINPTFCELKKMSYYVAIV